MKTFSAIIALLLFLFIFCSNFGCSDILTSPSSRNYIITLSISGIVTDGNNNPVDSASVEIVGYGIEWWRVQVANTITNEKGEYSIYKKLTKNSSTMPELKFFIGAAGYVINDAGEAELWQTSSEIYGREITQETQITYAQVINLQLTPPYY